MSERRGAEFDATMAFVKATIGIGILLAAVAAGVRLGRQFPAPLPAETVREPIHEERIYAPEPVPSPRAVDPAAAREPATLEPGAAEPAAVEPESRDEALRAPAPEAEVRTLEREPQAVAAPTDELPERVIVRAPTGQQARVAGGPDPSAAQRQIVVAP